MKKITRMSLLPIFDKDMTIESWHFMMNKWNHIAIVGGNVYMNGVKV